MCVCVCAGELRGVEGVGSAHSSYFCPGFLKRLVLVLKKYEEVKIAGVLERLVWKWGEVRGNDPMFLLLPHQVQPVWPGPGAQLLTT